MKRITRVMAIVLVSVTLLLALSTLIVYLYGRFAISAKGEPSWALALSANGSALDRLITPRLTAHPDQSGLMLLSSNPHAFAARVHSAGSAGRSLDLQYYYWKDDLTGGLLARQVLAAADRGVRVRILLDDINSDGGDSTYLALDSHPKIELRLFNPSRNRSDALRRGLELLMRWFSATRRMHNKAWIADGRVAIVGGRNIGDAYFDAAATINFRDMDILLVGPTVNEAEAIFDSFWNSDQAVPITALAGPESSLTLLRAKLDFLTDVIAARPYQQQLLKEENVQTMLAGDARLYWTTNARVISDPPQKATSNDPHTSLAKAIEAAMQSAKTELSIVSPYFIPGDDGTRLLQALRDKHVAVTVLTNTLAATDVAAVHGAYANYREALLAIGVSLFELKPEIAGSDISAFGSSGASLHTKAFIVDRSIGFIGSFNFDPRSISLNTEMGVLFEHEQLVSEMSDVFVDQLSSRSSYRLALRDRNIVWLNPTQSGIEELRSEPQASLWRRIVAGIISLLPLESQL